MSAAPIVTITKLGRWRWQWDVWFRGPSGGGPFRRGATWTRWGAEREAERVVWP